MSNQYYLLLCYYPKYFNKALALYNECLKKFPSLHLFVVDNSPGLAIKDLHPELDILNGDNSFGEFSGWQVAINAITESKSLEVNDFFILANDTANTHRYFTTIDRWLFLKSFSKAKETNAIAGEINNSKTSLRLNNTEFNQWVSTYFFCIPGQYLIQNKNSIIPCNLTHPLVLDAKPDKIIFAQQVDQSISQHINAWLFPSSIKKGWHSNRLASTEQLKHKATMIILEKSITWQAEHLKIKIISVYGSKLKKKYKRKMNRLYRRFHSH